MSEIVRGIRKAGDNWQTVHDDDSATIFGAPDWFFLPDVDEMLHFRGKKARRIATVKMTDDATGVVHLLSIDGEICQIVIFEDEQFTIAGIDTEMLDYLLLRAFQHGENVGSDSGLIVYSDDPNYVKAIRNELE